MRKVPAHPTPRYWRALDSLEAFVRRHREELERFLEALGRAEHAAKRTAGLIHGEFEDAAGVTKHVQLAGIEQDPTPAPLIIPTSLMEDLQATMERMSRELLKEYNAIRHNETFESVITTHEVLMQEMHDAVRECQTWEDHPLVAVRRQADDQWMTGLDEKNYDRASATTLTEIERVEKNKRDLESSDLNDKLERERAKEKWNKKLKDLPANTPGEFRSFDNEVIQGEEA